MAAAVVVLAVLTGSVITFIKYNQIRNINGQLTASIEKLQKKTLLQLRTISENKLKLDSFSFGKREIEKREQLSEHKVRNDLLLHKIHQQKIKVKPVVLQSNSIPKKTIVQLMHDHPLSEAIKALEDNPLKSQKIEIPINTVSKPLINNDNGVFESNQIEKSMALTSNKRPERRIKIRILNAEEPVENSSSNDVSIFKLFK